MTIVGKLAFTWSVLTVLIIAGRCWYDLKIRQPHSQGPVRFDNLIIASSGVVASIAVIDLVWALSA